MPPTAIRILLIMAGWTTCIGASDADTDPPMPEHLSPEGQHGLSMGILPHVLVGAEAYSSRGLIPWTSSDATEADRTNTLSYGLRVGTFYAITDDVALGLEVPYLARSHSDSDAANPALHPLPPKLGYPNRNAVVSLDFHF